MDCENLATGDSKTVKETSSHEIILDKFGTNSTNEEVNEKEIHQDAISLKIFDENEIKLKERVAQCKNLIESLKLELNEEKRKLANETKDMQFEPIQCSNHTYSHIHEKEIEFPDIYNVNAYSASVDSKLNCDENLMEYEKQLQRYQNTLTMAQIEKKNAIRKQMLTKAFKLKLMEVENQCNIELLRIKQSLQCLEPLQMIVEKWKDSNNDDSYDLNNFELIPRYPEVSVNSGSDIISGIDEWESKMAIVNPIEKQED